jgi:membrane-associated phospholipid phosphatase
VWPAIVTLAASRVLLLAHYPTDVIAGLWMGISIDRMMGTASRFMRKVVNRPQQPRGW